MGNRSGVKPEVIEKQFAEVIMIPKKGPVQISQIRLAEIMDCNKRIATNKRIYKGLWNTVRADLLAGATIEEGPLTAWMDSEYVIVRGKSKYKRTRMRVA
jgi:hypothetical protein